MKIWLQQAFSPEEMEERTCDVCDRMFRVESIIIGVDADDGYGLELACPGCLGIFAREFPDSDRFPSVEEYEALKKRYPGPIWPSAEAAGRAEEDREAYDQACEASMVWEPSFVREARAERDAYWRRFFGKREAENS